MNPLTSVVTPVHDGIKTIDRAVTSLRRQTSKAWELLAIDDASTDGSYERLLHWAHQDSRIRVHRMGENRGPSAARNEGIRHATGRMIAYLDCDDEFYPDFLEHVARLHDRVDVLIFGYDFLADGDDLSLMRKWDPTPLRAAFFEGNLSTPLGVAHRRELWSRVGGFDESLWCLEDWDFWKRLARAGAEFLFLPIRSGIYRFRKGSRSHTPRLTDHQHRQFEKNWATGAPLYDATPRIGRKRSAPSVLLAAPHTYVDPTNPLGIAASGFMQLLAGAGAAVQTYCPAPLKSPTDDLEVVLDRSRLPQNSVDATCGQFRARLISTRLGNVPVTFIRPHSVKSDNPGLEGIQTFLAFFENLIDNDRPDALVTFSDAPNLDPLIRLAKRRDIPIVLPLRDAPFTDRMAFAHADYCLVNSEAARRRYWQELGLACCFLPPAIDWERVQAEHREPRYVTFIAPSSGYGIFAFAQIAEQLARCRPDIPILVVDGHTRPLWYELLGLDLSRLSNVHTVSAVSDPRDFYSLTKILLMPWFGDVPLGLSVAESMVNGIPALVSSKGSLPEFVGDAGYVLDLPFARTPATAELLPVEAVEHWLEMIVRLWDDSVAYDRASIRARDHAEQWRPERVGPMYADFFRKVRPQPGPPFVPK